MLNMAEGKKRIAIIGVSSLILVGMVVALTIGITKGTGSKYSNRQEISTSVKAIKNVCESTDYKELCVKSLTSGAGNTTDPKDLIRAAFKEAIKEIEGAANNSAALQQLHRDPRTKQAIGNCQELAHDAINDLNRTFNLMGEIDGSKLNDMLGNMKTWLSGAITYQETCLDGFENTTGDAGQKMKDYLKTATQLTSNGLAMVTAISSTLSSMNIQGFNRRLLSTDKFPTWVSVGKRRLLKTKLEDIKPDLVVAKDGSGEYKTIHEAIDKIPRNRNNTFVLYIKEGVYDEKVQFNKSLTNVMVIGDGPTKTRITGKLNFVDGTSTFHTATVVVVGDNFLAKDIGFENSAGPEKHQAVAVRVGADFSVFYNCHFNGYQDTLYAHTYRQFYRNCLISGTVDFIFGDSAAIFQDCSILVRKPLPNQQNIVTAQGRRDLRQPTAVVLQNCTIDADPEFLPVKSSIKTYLGRPWKEYSRTVIMESYIGDLIDPSGWLPWEGEFGLNTLFYTEYNNRGPSADKSNRVKWKGVKEVKREVIERFTAGMFLKADSWLPETGVPYNSGLYFPAPVDCPNSVGLQNGEWKNDYNKSDYEYRALAPSKAKDSPVESPAKGSPAETPANDSPAETPTKDSSTETPAKDSSVDTPTKDSPAPSLGSYSPERATAVPVASPAFFPVEESESDAEAPNQTSHSIFNMFM